MAGLILKVSSVCRFSLSRHPCPSRVNRLKETLPINKPPSCLNFSNKSPWDVDTNVAKDVLLYHYENPKFHKYLNIFAITQLGFWFYLAEFSMSTLKDVPVESKGEQQNLPWYRNINLGENKYRRGITFMCAAVGVLFLGGSWMYSLKAIQSIVLRKGGNNVTFVTHAPFNKIRYLDVPLKDVSAAQSRHNPRMIQLPLKVKGYMGYFVVDMKGSFKNTNLFDATVGLKRVLK